MTVGELINKLSVLNPKVQIVILDADEGSTLLNISEITDQGEYIYIAGYYDDRFGSL